MKKCLLFLIIALMNNLVGIDKRVEEDVLGFKECYHDVLIEKGKAVNCILKKVVKTNDKFYVYIERAFADGKISEIKLIVKKNCVESVIKRLNEIGFMDLKSITPTNFPEMEDDSEAIYKIYKELRPNQSNLCFFGKFQEQQVDYNVYDVEMISDERYSQVYKLMCEFFSKRE